MWLGEQITERGIGNGISMIILAGIVAGCRPRLLVRHPLVSDGSKCHRSTQSLMLIGAVAAIIFVVYMERAQRRIPVNYARRQQGRKMYAAQSTHLPFKINMSGVIPPIFASSILMFPATIAQFFGGRRRSERLQRSVFADYWCQPRSRTASLRIAVRGDDYFLLLLLYGTDVQLEGHGR